MAEYQITYWRDLPSLVVARDGDDEAKVPLHARFQEAIDEAAMRLGDAAATTTWPAGIAASGPPPTASPAEVCDRRRRRLEEQWTPEAITTFLDGLGPARGGDEP